MAVLRSDIRERARDYLHESVAEIWTDAQLNRYYLEELRSLPRKNIYLEELWTTTLSSTTDYSDGITLPTGTLKVESVEVNDGTSSFPSWTELKGVDNYGGAIFLPYIPSTGQDIRARIRKYFTEVADDVTNLDIPDDKSEILVWGVVVRAYKQLIGFYRNSVSWDSVTKPGDVGLAAIQGWLRDAKTEYNNLLQSYQTTTKPRDIDLTG